MDRVKMKSFIITYIIIFLYAYIFFEKIILALLIAFFATFKLYTIVYEYLTRLNFKNKRIMFREFLDILNSNLISGQNLYQALDNTRLELKNLFSIDSEIVILTEKVLEDINNGFSMEDALLDFKNNINLEEANIFIDSLLISLESGINVSEVTYNAKEILNENISLELELSTITDNAKKEFLIMCILPMFVMVILRMNNPGKLTYIDYLIRFPIFNLILLSFYFGNKIVNKEI